MDILDRIYKSMLTMTIMSGLSLLLAAAMLPKGVPITKLPQFLMAMKHKYNGADLDQLLKAMQNEEEMAQVVSQLDAGHVAQPVAQAQPIENMKPKTVVIDPTELDALDKMNISSAMKEEIRRSYLQNGGVPGMSLKEVIEKAHEKDAAPDAAAKVADNGTVYDGGMTESEFNELMGMMGRKPTAAASSDAATAKSDVPAAKPSVKGAIATRSYEQAFRDLQTALDFKTQKPSN